MCSFPPWGKIYNVCYSHLLSLFQTAGYWTSILFLRKKTKNVSAYHRVLKLSSTKHQLSGQIHNLVYLLFGLVYVDLQLLTLLQWCAGEHHCWVWLLQVKQTLNFQPEKLLWSYSLNQNVSHFIWMSACAKTAFNIWELPSLVSPEPLLKNLWSSFDQNALCVLTDKEIRITNQTKQATAQGPRPAGGRQAPGLMCVSCSKCDYLEICLEIRTIKNDIILNVEGIKATPALWGPVLLRGSGLVLSPSLCPL